MVPREYAEEEERGFRDLRDRLKSVPGLVESLSDQEQRMAQAIAEGRRPYEIAMSEGISEDAVWTFVRALNNATVATGQRALSRGYETAGLGADTDPGVTGGYGDTGFGAIGNEGGEAVTEEPEEEKD
ncbi:MAG: helix-turn-helix transcriptional regulator [Bacteroidetes bacterium]|nr:helix-turn-helix transcriptional regulator [Bacteroidota bacterium]